MLAASTKRTDSGISTRFTSANGHRGAPRVAAPRDDARGEHRVADVVVAGPAPLARPLAHAERDEHAVARAPARDVRSHLLDDAAELVAEDVRQRDGEAEPAPVAHPEVPVERQIPFASTRRTTPFGAGIGSSTSRTTSGCRTPSMTAAFIVRLDTRAAARRKPRSPRSRTAVQDPGRRSARDRGGASADAGTCLAVPARHDTGYLA
jgi:hypothetical protein